MSRLNPVAHEPVAVVVLAAILTWALARYGVKVDPQQASDAAGVVLLVGGAFARQLVRPVAKDSTLLPLLEKPEAPTAPPNNTVNTGWSPKVKPARDSTPERPDPTRTT